MNRLLIASCILLPTLAWGTTKGLNQIVTPDLQPFGQLSISFQAQHSIISNPYQIQYELGVSRHFEVAAFQAYDPTQVYMAAEYGLIQTSKTQLSVGFLNWSSRGDVPQPFIEAGLIRGNARYIGGVQRQLQQNLPIWGFAYQANKDLLVQADYLGGPQNFTTVGFTYSVTPAVTFNPALYMANSRDHKLYPYMVLSWTITAWK